MLESIGIGKVMAVTINPKNKTVYIVRVKLNRDLMLFEVGYITSILLGFGGTVGNSTCEGGVEAEFAERDSAKRAADEVRGYLAL